MAVLCCGSCNGHPVRQLRLNRLVLYVEELLFSKVIPYMIFHDIMMTVYRILYMCTAGTSLNTPLPLDSDSHRGQSSAHIKEHMLNLCLAMIKGPGPGSITTHEGTVMEKADRKNHTQIG